MGVSLTMMNWRRNNKERQKLLRCRLMKGRRGEKGRGRYPNKKGSPRVHFLWNGCLLITVPVINQNLAQDSRTWANIGNGDENMLICGLQEDAKEPKSRGRDYLRSVFLSRVQHRGWQRPSHASKGGDPLARPTGRLHWTMICL